MSLPPLNHIDMWTMLALEDLATAAPGDTAECYAVTSPTRVLNRVNLLRHLQNGMAPLPMWRVSASLAYLEESEYVYVHRVGGVTVYALLADMDGTPTVAGVDSAFWGIVGAEA